MQFHGKDWEDTILRNDYMLNLRLQFTLCFGVTICQVEIKQLN